MTVACYEVEWQRIKLRNKIHLSFLGCLDLCAVGNNALLQLYSHTIWFKDLNGDEYIPAIYDYVETNVGSGPGVAATSHAGQPRLRTLSAITRWWQRRDLGGRQRNRRSGRA